MQAADFWAIGVTVFAVIYRKLPFYDTNELKLIKLI